MRKLPTAKLLSSSKTCWVQTVLKGPAIGPMMFAQLLPPSLLTSTYAKSQSFSVLTYCHQATVRSRPANADRSIRGDWTYPFSELL